MFIIVYPAAAVGGTGTAGDPYIIQTPIELQSIQNDLAAYYVLGNNIDLSGVIWTPIGTSSSPTTTGFHGFLDGAGHTISNLNYNNSTIDNIGLFAVITTGATINDISFIDCNIIGKANVGLLFGSCIMADGVNTQAVITNVDSSNCVVTGTSSQVGGIAGYCRTYSNITFIGCDVADGMVESTSGYSVGGIAGFGAFTNSTATFTSCTATGMHVKASGNSVGGIAGFGAHTNSTAEFVSCEATNCVIESTSGNYVGGIAGFGAHTTSTAEFVSCEATNCVMKGGITVGGIAGFGASTNSTAQFDNCVAKFCTISATSNYAGGICGKIYTGCIGTFEDCTSQYNSIVTPSYAAGICPAWA